MNIGLQVVGRCFVLLLANMTFLLYSMNHILSLVFVFLGSPGYIIFLVFFSCIMSH